MGTIKRGVSLYSYQNETFQGKMTLEDCIRTSAECGANGIEFAVRMRVSYLPFVPTTKDSKELALAA